MDFSTSVFMYPLHAVRPYTQRSCLTRPKDLTRASALYTQLAALPGLRPLNLLNVAKQHLNAA